MGINYFSLLLFQIALSYNGVFFCSLKNFRSFSYLSMGLLTATTMLSWVYMILLQQKLKELSSKEKKKRLNRHT